MTPILRHDSPAAQVWEGDCRAVAAGIEPGSCSLAVLDGPYGCGKSKVWDRMKVADLPKWYAPHLDDVDRVCAPSASLYVWNTAEGWATLHPGIVGRGWTFRALVVWDKTVAHMAGRVDTEGLRTWFDVSEVCGFYQREEWAPSTCAGSEIAQATGADPRNPTPAFYRAEREAAGMSKRDMARHFPSATGGLTGCVANWEGGLNYPTWEVWQKSAAAMTEHGPERARPYLVHPDIWAGEDRDPLRATYDHLRAEYEASRPAFTCPMGIGNVWTHPPVAGPERLRGPDGSTLHPCQKPLAFADRILRASMRPGETAWVPFGGTLREAVAAERIARAEPGELRRVITAELNQDGVDYIGPALRQLRGEGTKRRDPRQGDMFARGEP